MRFFNIRLNHRFRNRVTKRPIRTRVSIGANFRICFRKEMMIIIKVQHEVWTDLSELSELSYRSQRLRFLSSQWMWPNAAAAAEEEEEACCWSCLTDESVIVVSMFFCEPESFTWAIQHSGLEAAPKSLVVTIVLVAWNDLACPNAESAILKRLDCNGNWRPTANSATRSTSQLSALPPSVFRWVPRNRSECQIGFCNHHLSFFPFVLFFEIRSIDIIVEFFTNL